MTKNVGVPASPSGHSRAEPEVVSVVPTSVPNAARFRDTVFASITIGLVTEKRLLSYDELVGRLSGSREPSPSCTGLGAPRVDPGRKEGGNS